ncbi:MAG: hypothetical protein ACR2OX_00880 [Methyloligellaceae bacterium]
MHVHVVECEEELKPLGASSKLNSEWTLLTHLRDVGRRTASSWFDKNFKRIGKACTIDLKTMLEGNRHYG